MKKPIIITSCLTSTEKLIRALGDTKLTTFGPEAPPKFNQKTLASNDVLLLFPELVLNPLSQEAHPLEQLYLQQLFPQESKVLIILTSNPLWLKNHIHFTHLILGDTTTSKIVPIPLFIINFMNFYGFFLPLSKFLSRKNLPLSNPVSLPYSFVDQKSLQIRSKMPLYLECRPSYSLREVTCSATIFMKYILYRTFLPRESIGRRNTHSKKLISRPTYYRKYSSSKWKKYSRYLLRCSIFRKKQKI